MSADTTKKDSNGASNIAGRWWESDLVRYFIGTLLGSLLVGVLAWELRDALQQVFQFQLDPTVGVATYMKALLSRPAGVAGMIIAGLAFCYVSSAPITVIHATRMYRGFPNSWARWIWMGWAAFGFLFLAVYVIGRVVPSSTLVLLFIGVPALWVWLAQYFCVINLWRDRAPRTSRFISFYVDLSLARQRAKAQGLRESYTHLREHSNSIFIVAIEISLACLLTCLIQLSEWDTAPTSKFGMLSIFVLTWLIPNVFLWGRANALEGYLRDNPLRFGR